jgi:hypothetical protein
MQEVPQQEFALEEERTRKVVSVFGFSCLVVG